VPPTVSDFSFSFGGSTAFPVSFVATSSGFGSGPPPSFVGSLDVAFFGSPYRAEVTIGELETSLINGTETVSHFAADFRVQFLTAHFGATPDPVTGLLVIGPTYEPIVGDWYEGSLRFQSDTPAFAFSATAVPEPSALALSIAGLIFLVLVSRRRTRISTRQ
jgi:hypothetical protein